MLGGGVDAATLVAALGAGPYAYSNSPLRDIQSDAARQRLKIVALLVCLSNITVNLTPSA